MRIGFFTILIVLMVLKLAGVIALSWWWLLAILALGAIITFGKLVLALFALTDNN